MDPHGRVNIKSFADAAAFYRKQGLITGNIKVEDVVDGSFVEAA